MAKNPATKQKGKRKWPVYIGIFSVIGAIVMMASGNTAAAYFYIFIATCCFGYFFGRKPNEPVSTSLPIDEPLPEEPKPAPQDNGTVESVQPPVDDFVNKTYRVTGVQHYADNLLKIAVPNSNYDMSKKEIIDFGLTDQYIWEHEFYPSKLELQPEPDNPHDPNAIKVLIDDMLVGYIKSGSCKHLLNIIEQGRFLGASCKIGGGRYKRVNEDYDYDRDKSTYSLDKDERDFSIVLTVKEQIK